MPDHAPIPETPVLLTILEEAMGSRQSRRVKRVVAREEFRQGTAPKEFVEVELADGSRMGLLVKYAFGGYGLDDHRRGLEWELTVYREYLKGFDDSVPALLGEAREAEGRLTAVFERIGNAQPVSWVPQCLPLAAAWLGDFHRRMTNPTEPAGGLPALGLAQVDRWIESAIPALASDGAFARTLSANRARILAALSNAVREAPTLIHGEFYPQNILVRDGRVCIVDWESAVLGFPEIDLACLLEHWSPDARVEARESYCRARWSESPADSGLDRRLALAQLYWFLRWLPVRRPWFDEREPIGGPPSRAERAEWWGQILQAMERTIEEVR